MNDNNNMTTLPKKGLKTRHYSKDMEKRELKTRHYSKDMEKKDLKKLTKGQLIKLLLKQEAKKPIPPPGTEKWKSVNEDIIIPTPEQFRDRPPKSTRKSPQLQNQITISILTMTYSKPKTQALEIKNHYRTKRGK